MTGYDDKLWQKFLRDLEHLQMGHITFKVPEVPIVTTNKVLKKQEPQGA